MQSGSRDDVRALTAQLVEAYWAGESTQSISRRSGRAISTIHKAIKADIRENGDRVRAKKPEDPRIMANKKVLSPRHSWIGIRLARYRAEHDLTPTALGMQLDATRVVIRNMELGAHDFTITQIEKIAQLLDIPFMNLITPGLVSVTQ